MPATAPAFEQLEDRLMLAAAPVQVVADAEPNNAPATAVRASLMPGETDITGTAERKGWDYFTLNTGPTGGILTASRGTFRGNWSIISQQGQILLGKSGGTTRVGANQNLQVLVQGGAKAVKYSLALTFTEGGVDPARLAKLAKTVNVANWLRLPYWTSQDYFQNHISQAELQNLAAMGFTGVRLCVAPDLIFDKTNPARPDATFLGYVRNAISRITAAGLAVVVDLHDEHASLLSAGTKVVNQVTQFWSAFAGALSDTDPNNVFFELVNEQAFQGQESRWPAILNQLLTAVRQAAPRHTIIATGPVQSSIDALIKMQPVLDTNVVYTFHFYEPMTFTHQGAFWVAGPYGSLHNIPYPSATANAYTIKQRVDLAASWSAKYGVPLWVGEFGAYGAGGAPVADRLTWIRDVRSALEADGIGWSLWCYDDTFGLSRRADAYGNVTVDRATVAALGLKAA